jgi:hypothetical protein
MQPDPEPFRIDCVQMKRDIQAQLHEETKHMTMAELVDFINRRAEVDPLRLRWKAKRDAAGDAEKPDEPGD